MNLQEILNPKEEITYALYATHDDINWFSLGIRKNEYETPKKILSALKTSWKRTNINDFKNVILVKLTKQVLVEEVDLKEYK